MTVETHVPIAELARHGATVPVINALRRSGIFLVDELGEALERHDAAIAAGQTSERYLTYQLYGIGPALLAQARVAYEVWQTAQQSTKEPCDRQAG
jgi:hypothetical protein